MVTSCRFDNESFAIFPLHAPTALGHACIACGCLHGGLEPGAASEHHVPLPQTAMTRQLMDAARAHGDADADYAAIIKAVERSAGLPT